jgi:MoaA/NifB/PqqE/SkfB family radical SAM enzyme
MQLNEGLLYAQVDREGRLVLSPELASRYGVKPGMRIHFEESSEGVRMHLSAHLAKLYIEPTNQCNLDCRTCIRNVWDEPMGQMSEAIFGRIIEGLRAYSSPPAIFFGGFGEPLFHPGIVKMVAQAKALGAKVELISNATLLTAELSRELIRSGLDTLWVSLDGATPESYSDIRLGAALPLVLENLQHFREASYAESDCAGCCGFVPKTRLGIVFVAMKRNITDLPAVVNLGQRLGAESFLVTNVLPYTKEMVDEALYYRTINNSGYGHLSLPGIDIDETTYDPIYQAIRNAHGALAGLNSEVMRNQCPFIANGVGAIGWDGSLSPCLPLLHSHTSYLGFLQNEKRFSRRWSIGNLMERSLSDLWNTPEHIAFRERVQAFDFSPCTTCGSCELIEKNEDDCCGNSFPTCGGCLWAQGVIRCP